MDVKELTERVVELTAEIAEAKEDRHNLHCRMDEMKKQMGEQNRLTESVYKLASEVAHMREEMNKMDVRLAGVENKPVKRWETIITAIITAAVGGIIGFIISHFTF